MVFLRGVWEAGKNNFSRLSLFIMCKSKWISLTLSNSTFWGCFFLFCLFSPDCFFLPVPWIPIYILPLHYTSSPSSRQYHPRAAAPHHQSLTIPTSQQLFPPKSFLEAVPEGNSASFLLCVTWSEEPDWLTGTKMDIPVNWGFLDTHPSSTQG